jgi:hypothetical protein
MPRLSEIRIPGSEFRNVIILDEFNGEYSLIAGQVNNQNDVFPKWAFPQTKDRQPGKKAIPVKVSLGDRKENAIKFLRQLADSLGSGDGKHYQGPGDDYQPPADGDIPF